MTLLFYHAQIDTLLYRSSKIKNGIIGKHFKKNGNITVLLQIARISGLFNFAVVDFNMQSGRGLPDNPPG